MNINARPSPQIATRRSVGSIAQSTEPIDELVITNRLRRLTGSDNLRVQDALINLYVSLKSKPLTLLIGPKGCEKTNLIKGLANILTSQTVGGFQLMNGHAEWAKGSSKLAMLVNAQTRFTSSKLLALLEEAYQPENRGKNYIACIADLSQAELFGYFNSLAFQLRQNYVMRFPGIHFRHPISYPDNLSIIGTMEKLKFGQFNEDLLKPTNVVFWNLPDSGRTINLSDSLAETWSCPRISRFAISSSVEAKAKIRQIPLAHKRLEQIQSLLASFAREVRIKLHPAAFNELSIYISNAWTNRTTGLFDANPERNFYKAFDFALAQSVLPRVGNLLIQSGKPNEIFTMVLGAELPHTQSVLRKRIFSDGKPTST